MDLGIAGKVAVVTAASRGIGAATVLALSAEGVTVACCARSGPALKELAARSDGQAGHVHTWTVDMAEPEATERFLDEVAERLGPPDILVNNFGASPSRNFLYMSDEDWLAGLDVNLLSAVRCSRRVLPGMRQKGWGRIVMVSSGAAKYPTAPLVDYGAAKAALVSLTTSLARKYGGDGVLVNAVLPGLIRTDMWERTAAELAEHGSGSVEDVFAERSTQIPVGRFGTAEEVADLITYLASERATYVSGAAIDIDGGRAGHLF